MLFTSFAKPSFHPLADLFISRIQSFGAEIDKARWQQHLQKITDLKTGKGIWLSIEVIFSKAEKAT